MTQYEKITRANAMDIIRRFAKEYRKALGNLIWGYSFLFQIQIAGRMQTLSRMIK